MDLVAGIPGITLPDQVTVSIIPTGMSAVVPVQCLADILARRVLDAKASPEVSEADRSRMTASILRLASDAVRHLLEAMMTTSEYQKTFVEKIHDQGIAEGEAKGKAEGEAKGKAKAVLKLLDARHLAPSTEQRQQVTSCTDTAQLDLWFDRAITAGTAGEVFTD